MIIILMIIFKVLGINFESGVTRQIEFDQKLLKNGELNLNVIINLFLEYRFGDKIEKFIKYENIVLKSKQEILTEEEQKILNPSEIDQKAFQSIVFLKNKLIQRVSFLSKGSMINENYKSVLTEHSDNVTIHVFTNDATLKPVLKELFLKAGNKVDKISYVQNTQVKQETSESLKGKISSVPPKEIFLSEDLIKKRNEKFEELLNSPKFLQLVGIYYTEPELFKTLLGFIESGTVFVKNILELIDKEKSNNEYTEELEEIKKYNINVPDKTIVSILNKFKGDKMLTLRYLICTKGIIESSIDNSEDNPIIQQYKTLTAEVKNTSSVQTETKAKLSNELLSQINNLKKEEVSL